MATPGLDVLPFGAQLIDPERLAHSRRMPLDVFAGRMHQRFSKRKA